MVAGFYHPGAPLEGFVERFWYFKGYAVDHERERALPTGTVELVINLGEDRMRIFKDDEDRRGQSFRESVICGPQSRYFVLDTSHSSAAVLGIHFHPGGATPFLRMPADELTDRHVAVEDVWGPCSRELRERLLEAGSPDAMFALLEAALRARLMRPPLIHPAVAHALNELTAFPEVARISQVQDGTGYSAKRFIELFSGSVGLTPKLYCRIQRFQSVLARIVRAERVEWAGVALDGGYCDQSHLNREFRTFSALTPANYQPVAKNRPSHVAIGGRRGDRKKPL